MIYRIIIEKGEDFGFVVHCPAIPGCHSQGGSIEEAVENIKDAIRGCISVMEPEENSPDYIGAMEIAVGTGRQPTLPPNQTRRFDRIY
ncbi:MAG: type II toxin-antitoxin system HicB family antitoxin [Victivallales bacterium]|nr:type II toxin-antitoxin system HicB family antitoxin [Victivallales bacterium]